MAGTKHQYKVGQQWIVTYPEHLSGPTVGRIAVLTNEPGRYIGIEFDGPVHGGSDLGGKCAQRCGLWVHPAVHLLTIEEHKALELAGQSNPVIPVYAEVTTIEFDPDSNVVIANIPEDLNPPEDTDTNAATT